MEADGGDNKVEALNSSVVLSLSKPPLKTLVCSQWSAFSSLSPVGGPLIRQAQSNPPK